MSERDGLAGLDVRRFAPADAPELLVLQRCCWVQEALANDTLDIPALHESLEDVRRWGEEWLTLVARRGPRLVGAVRARETGEDWEVGRLMVAPDESGRGLGRQLLAAVEALAPPGATRATLFTGARSTRNLRLYARAGYEVDEVAQRSPAHVPGTVALAKPLPPGRAPARSGADPAPAGAAAVPTD
ncbi:GNAT family N-acetyltransferase [Aquipuribacter sp. SD81]|uniref:GNAT family N-acetyltransferase n=1 Tax=Aquipuribacter sp. SD81 TaxID=3127703 RepID=UPI0030196C05